ncbi:MAG TPA: MBL fold metallo-hydrolase [Casimicrobiaceae bacterium]|nr:MBL fold metallo-hydrolase [Casimicrobiaceae bacterium]
MRLHLYGGFGEKGRTCLGVEADGYRLLLDAGVKTSARGADYYPAITADELGATDAIVITHAHEDHVAALGWCIAGGFRGRLLMTAETGREVDLFLEAYADASHRELAREYAREDLAVGATIALGPLQLVAGRSGHVSGGVWCVVADGRHTLGYCGDVVPASEVFAMDPLPHCDAVVIDASYGDDDVNAQQRANEVRDWVLAHRDGCVLPTPLSGRSAELLAIVPGAIALSEGMRRALQQQIADPEWLAGRAAERLSQRLELASDWRTGSPLPRAALICHDGMGIAGPSREALEQAAAAHHPVLFTGHLPDGSPGERMLAAGQATWLRLPTHPTSSENAAIVANSAAKIVLGHSCERPALEQLKRHIPRLRADLATGDWFEL